MTEITGAGDRGADAAVSGKKQMLSAIGALLDAMEIQSVYLARAVHVDASLVSKWKSGERRPGADSAYFAGIEAFFMQPERRGRLKSALRSFYPLERLDDEKDIKRQLEAFLSGTGGAQLPAEAACAGADSVPVRIFEHSEGRRRAVSELLSAAEAMDEPGSVSCVDAEQYEWLLEDEEYAAQWVKRMLALLDRGFRARFAVHFRPGTDPFLRFFKLCGPLLFHRNMKWYRHRYYDEENYWFSFFILESAISVMGMAMARQHSYTALFRDRLSVMNHRAVVDAVVESCEPFFEDFGAGRCGEAAARLESAARGGRLWAYLPVPALICCGTEIVDSVLKADGENEEERGEIESFAARFRRVLETAASERGGVRQIFQYDRMRRCVSEPFSSCSLSIFANRPVAAQTVDLAKAFAELAERLESESGVSAALTTERDFAQISEMNCWCLEDRWLIQMDRSGFRFCSEPVIVTAATAVLERAWRRIPPQRKDKHAAEMVRELAAEMRGEGGSARNAE